MIKVGTHISNIIYLIVRSIFIIHLNIFTQSQKDCTLLFYYIKKWSKIKLICLLLRSKLGGLLLCSTYIHWTIPKIFGTEIVVIFSHHKSLYKTNCNLLLIKYKISIKVIYVGPWLYIIRIYIQVRRNQVMLLFFLIFCPDWLNKSINMDSNCLDQKSLKKNQMVSYFFILFFTGLREFTHYSHLIFLFKYCHDNFL